MKKLFLLVVLVFGIILLSVGVNAEIIRLEGNYENNTWGDPGGLEFVIFEENEFSRWFGFGGEMNTGEFAYFSFICTDFMNSLDNPLGLSSSQGFIGILDLNGSEYEGRMTGKCYIGNTSDGGRTFHITYGLGTVFVDNKNDSSVMFGTYGFEIIMNESGNITDGGITLDFFKNGLVEKNAEKISILESWKVTIDATLNTVMEQINIIKGWLFFDIWTNDESETICTAIANECNGTVSCTDECLDVEIGCSDVGTRWYCEKQTDGCYEKIEEDCDAQDTCFNGICISPTISCSHDSECGTEGWENNPYCGDGENDGKIMDTYTSWTCMNAGTIDSWCDADVEDKVFEVCGINEYCENGACHPLTPPPGGDVVFRTNVESGDYYDCTLISKCWMAFDFDGDSNLDEMGFDGKSPGCSQGNIVELTPEGYDIVDYGSSTKLGICDDQGRWIRFSTRRTKGDEELSSDPTEPYASNGQEVYAGLG